MNTMHNGTKVTGVNRSTISMCVVAILVALLSTASFADGPRRMIGTDGSGTLGDGTTGSAAFGKLTKAIAWNAEDGGDVVTPWSAGSNQCVYVIKSAKKLSSNDTFPDVPVRFELEGTVSANPVTLMIPQATFASAASGKSIQCNGVGTLYLNGNWTIASGATMQLSANAVAMNMERDVCLLGDKNGNSKGTLTGDADTVIRYSFSLTANSNLVANALAESKFSVVGGDASAFKGKYVIADTPARTIGTTNYLIRTRVVFDSPTAFGDPSSVKADALTLGNEVYLELRGTVNQTDSRGITIKSNKRGGVFAGSGASWALSTPVICESNAKFAKVGEGTVTLSGRQTGLGSVVVAEGTLVLGELGTFPADLTVVVSNGATLVQHKHIPNISVDVKDGGTYTRDILYTIPYDVAENETEPLDFRDGVPPLPLSLHLSDRIDIDYFAAHDYATNRLEVAKLPSDTTATGDDFADVTEKTYGLPRTYFEIEDKGTYKALILVAKPVIFSTRDFKDADGGANADSASSYPWSDGKAAHSGADYLLTNGLQTIGTSVFRGDSLTVASVSARVEMQLRSGDGENARLDKTWVYNNVWIVPNHGQVANVVLHGDLTLMGGFGGTETSQSTVFRTLRTSNGNLTRMNLAAELKGEGSSYLHLYDNCNDRAAQTMELEISGLNTNYYGIFVANGGSLKDQGVSKSPDETNHMDVVIGDARNLGGPLPEFTYNALQIQNCSMLKVKNDVTLGTENRGIYVTSGKGGFVTPEGTTLTIKEKLTLNGSFYKHGAGTLALGGELDLKNASAKCLVREGAVKVLSDAAVAGLDLKFSDGTAIVLDPCAEIENGITGDIATVNPGEKIALRLSLESLPAGDRPKFTIPVCTVPTATGDISGLFAVEKLRGYNVQIVTSSVEVDSVPCTRYSVCYTPCGFTIIVR